MSFNRKKYQRKKITVSRVFAAAVLMSSLILVSCSDEEPANTAAADEGAGATDYTQLVSSAVPVREAPLRDTVTGSGIIEGQLEAVVRAKSPGSIEKISFELGDELMQGQVLVSLNADIAELNVRQLEQQYQNAQADVESKEELYERGSLSFTQLAQARAALSGAEAQLTQARNTLNNMQITTPIRGKVAARSSGLVIGDSVQPGQEIARIVDLENLRVRLSLGQDQVFLVREGYQARISIETPGKNYRADGVVKAVSAGSDLRTGSWTALVDFPNPASDTLKAGMIADVTIINKDAPLYTVVPGDAVAYRDGKTWVYVVENRTVSRQEIAVADQFGNLTAVEVPDGASPLLGKSVLVSGLSNAESGERAAVNSPEYSEQ